MLKISLIAGARPNFMKVAPLLREIEGRRDMRCILVHTGQHYDQQMSEAFFKSLGIREPDFNLQVGSGSHGWQTAQIIMGLEELFKSECPELAVVVGDVNSTVAAALVAKKMHMILAHVEAGLRSGNRAMPEEINRIVTDSISDHLFATENQAVKNLLNEGHVPKSIHLSGNVMVDNLLYQISAIGESVTDRVARIKSKFQALSYYCLTLHRPENVDHRRQLKTLLEPIREIARDAPVFFPCHPRTRKRIEEFGFSDFFANGDECRSGRISILEPLDYRDFLFLWKDAAAVITDSGGLQEETTALKVPCITVRNETERPITVEIGSNVVVGNDGSKLVHNAREALAGRWKKCSIPEFWDGHASKRIVDVLEKE
jgi:UDP-N-acetylglucosamine 2-epimerase (non-hydrolysing)